MLASFLITFVLLAVISVYAFTKFKYSNGFGILNLIIIALAVGLREFGYDYYSYKNIYESIVNGYGYIIEWMTQFIITTSHSTGIGLKGFLSVYALLTFSLIYVISRMERVSLTILLSVYCILLFSTGPLVTIRSSLSSLIFCIAFLLYFRKKKIQSFLATALAIAFHGAALAAVAIVLLVAIGKSALRDKRKALLVYFSLISLVIHSIVLTPNIFEYIGYFSENDLILMLAGRVEAYQSYVWLDFSSIVHYFQIASIITSIICYSLLNPASRELLEHGDISPPHQQDIFSADIINSSIVFGIVSFLYFNLVWGVRIMEFVAPLLAVLIVKYGQNRKKFPLLLLCSINLTNVFLGYMSSLNWKF